MTNIFILLYQSVRPSALKFLQCGPSCKKFAHPELCDPNQAFVHYMLENGFTVLSLENENLSREKKNRNSCDYLLCWLSVRLFALREFAL